MKKAIISFFIFLFLITPFFINADNGNGETGLVPCGPGTSPPDPATVPEGYDVGVDYTPCELCHLFQLFSNIISFLLTTVVPAVAGILFIYGGFYYFTSGGNPTQLGKARQIIIGTVTGIIIIYGAHLGITSFLSSEQFGIGVVEDLENWPSVEFTDCPSPL